MKKKGQSKGKKSRRIFFRGILGLEGTQKKVSETAVRRNASESGAASGLICFLKIVALLDEPFSALDTLTNMICMNGT